MTSRGTRPRIWRLLLVILFASGVTFLAPGLDPSIPVNLPRTGDVATGTIVASRELTIRKTADELLAEQKSIRSEIPLILDFDTIAFQGISEKIDTVVRLFSDAGTSDSDQSILTSSLVQTTGLSAEMASLIVKSAPTLRPLLGTFRTILFNILNGPGVAVDDATLSASELRTVIIRRGTREEVINRDRVLRPEQSRTRMIELLNQEPRFDPSTHGLLVQLGSQLLRPTLTLNKNEHDIRVQYEIDRLDSIAERVSVGSVILRAGQVVTAREARLLEHYLIHVESTEHGRVVGDIWIRWGARWLLVALTAIGLIAFMRRFRREIYRSLPKLFAIFLFLTITVVGAIVAARVGAYSNMDVLTFLPVGLLAILITLLIDTEVALLTTICLAMLFGLLERFSFAATLHTVIVGTMSAFLAANMRRRSDAFRVVLLVGIVTIGSLLLVRVVTGVDITQMGTTLAAASGVSVASTLVCIFILVPIAESLFGFTTDIRLLELTDLNHPVLKRLAVEASGTYHHSLQVSNLSEAAAKAIGGNVLLTRAGALFHDIGKMEIPEYFVENQMGLKSRHEPLAPTMSALILASHVKRGRKLGEEADLPDDVLNFIEEHHGTMVMSYFYKKAQEQSSPAERLDLTDTNFRYPGPKPQSRETGIVMLADAVEASSRTLDEPKPARIESLIQKIVADRFSSGELDECPLTLRDLAKIRHAFAQVVIAMFHQRVHYPKGIQPE